MGGGGAVGEEPLCVTMVGNIAQQRPNPRANLVLPLAKRRRVAEFGWRGGFLLEEAKQDLGRGVGDAEGLHSKLLLDLQGLQPRRFPRQIGIDQRPRPSSTASDTVVRKVSWKSSLRASAPSAPRTASTTFCVKLTTNIAVVAAAVVARFCVLSGL
ncbi:MAG: hypothetical protein QGF53_00515 [Alphaproteobacteria bacterium]|nr:hypothetical protein [Alphaproteobacteria bacterium]